MDAINALRVSLRARLVVRAGDTLRRVARRIMINQDQVVLLRLAIRVLSFLMSILIEPGLQFVVKILLELAYVLGAIRLALTISAGTSDRWVLDGW